jgi:hypothetical protein
LNGSKFNYLILSAENNPRKLDRVILSVQSEGGPVPPPPIVVQDDEPAAVEEQSIAQAPQPLPGPGPMDPLMIPPKPQPEVKPLTDENNPDQ